MVTSYKSNHSNSYRGFLDWWAQRVSAVIIAAYAIFLGLFIVLHPHLSYFSWIQLFASRIMRVATVLTLLSILWHAWIGLWTVFTDYVKHYPTRLLLQTLLLIISVAYVLWVLDILAM